MVTVLALWDLLLGDGEDKFRTVKQNYYMCRSYLNVQQCTMLIDDMRLYSHLSLTYLARAGFSKPL